MNDKSTTKQPTQAEAASEREAFLKRVLAVLAAATSFATKKARDGHEAVLLELRAALATQQAVQAEQTCVDEGCPHYGTQHVHSDPENWNGKSQQQPEALAQQERDREDADYLCKLVDAIGKDVLGVLKQYGDAKAAIGLMASRTKEAIRAARSRKGDQS